MAVQTKLIRDGNSWGLRLPKAVMELAGFKANQAIKLEVIGSRIIIRPARGRQAPVDDRFKQAKRDAKRAWDDSFEETWLEIFGVDE